jgi:epoxide hydrolase-like predicted phosphatase
MKPKTDIAAVLWDLGGVILKTEDTSHREVWEKRFDLEPWGLEKLVFGNKVSRQASGGEASVDDIWEYVQDQLGLVDEDMAGFKKDFFAGDEIDQDLMDFIRSIKKNMKSGMITNAWPGMRHYIEEVWNIADAFDVIVVSAEVNLVKPHPEIFNLALEQLELDPEETIFIDDFIENVQGAEAIGMTGIHFVSTDDVVANLRGLLNIDN